MGSKTAQGLAIDNRRPERIGYRAMADEVLETMAETTGSNRKAIRKPTS